MDGLEDVIGQILSDPEQMAQILSLARSLGGGAASQEDAQQPTDPSSLLDDMAPVLEVMRQAGRADQREVTLLNALKPYCSKERQGRIERAVRIARLSQIAGAALRSFEKKE